MIVACPGCQELLDVETTSFCTECGTPLKAPQESAPKETREAGEVLLDLYRIEEVLDASIGERRWRVRHLRWGSDVLVRAPARVQFVSGRAKERFTRELEGWTHLGLHPNITSCYYVRTIDDLPHLFSEWDDSTTLQEAIRNRSLYQQAALAQVLHVAIGIARGLSHAHEQGVLHQTLSPASVLFRPDGVARVTDIGLARALAVASVSTPALTAYGSPEQVGHGVLTPRTDIYSWAVTVLEMFTGAVTWMSGHVAGETLNAYMQMGPNDPTLPPMPPRLAYLLHNCLSWETEQRPASFAEMLPLLEDIYRETMGSAYPWRAPDASVLAAASLNNQALCYLDRGEEAAARAAWQGALAANPHHSQSLSNYSILLWRRGELTDEELLSRLSPLADSGRSSDRFVLGLVQLERGDVDAGLGMLEEASQQAPDDNDIKRALDLARSGEIVPARCRRCLEGHIEGVRSIAVTPDSRFAVSGSFPQYASSELTLRVWEVHRGQCLQSFGDFNLPVLSVGLDAQASRVMAAGADGAMLLDARSGKPLHFFRMGAETAPITLTAAALSGDSTRVVTGGDNVLAIWNGENGELIGQVPHPGSVRTVAVTPDGDWAVTGNEGGLVVVWEVTTGRMLTSFDGHAGAVTMVAISEDARRVLSASEDGTARVWDVAGHSCLHVLRGHSGPVLGVDVVPGARWALSGGQDGTMRLWEMSSGRCLHTFKEHSDAVYGVRSSQQGRWAVSCSEDRRIFLWELPRPLNPELKQLSPFRLSYIDEKAVEQPIEERVAQRLQEAANAVKSRRFAAALDMVRSVRQIPVFERKTQALDSWRMLTRFAVRTQLRTAWLARRYEGHQGGSNFVCVTDNLEVLVSGGDDKVVKATQVEGPPNYRYFEGATREVTCGGLSQNGRWIVAGGRDQAVRFWELSSGRLLRVIDNGAPVRTLTLSRDAWWLFVGTEDGAIRVWHQPSARCLRVQAAHSGPVTALCLSPDEMVLLSTGEDRMVRMWDVASGKCLTQWEAHRGPITAAALTVNRVATASADRTLRVWDLDAGCLLQTCEGHTKAVTSVAFTPDSNWLISGGADETVRLWEAETGRELHKLEGHTNKVISLCTSREGDTIFSGSLDGVVLRWQIDWELAPPSGDGWDARADAWLDRFIHLHTPYAMALPEGTPSPEALEAALTRSGAPFWHDLSELMDDLGNAGLGWLPEETVQEHLNGKLLPDPLAGQAATAAPVTLRPVERYGVIKRLELPPGWIEAMNGSVPYYGGFVRVFEPTDSEGVRLGLFYRGTAVDPQAAQSFTRMLNEPPHPVGPAELAQLAPVLGPAAAPEAFYPFSARTESWQGMTLFILEGLWVREQVQTFWIFLDVSGSGEHIQEIWYQAPASEYERFMVPIRAAFQAMEWQ
ncbi:MAG: protein kinase [Candidatus Xenobia bacterium]